MGQPRLGDDAGAPALRRGLSWGGPGGPGSFYFFLLEVKMYV